MATDAATNAAEAAPEVEKPVEEVEEKGEGEGDGEELALAVPKTAEEFMELAIELSGKREFSEAIAAAQEAAQKAKDDNDLELEIKARGAVVEAMLNDGNGVKAMEEARSNRSFCHGVKDREGEALAMVGMAKAHFVENEPQSACRAGAGAIKLCDKHNLTEVKLRAMLVITEAELMLLRHMATIVVKSKAQRMEFDAVTSNACGHADEAVKLAEEVEDFSLWATAECLRAKALLTADKLEESKLSGSKARYLCERIGDKVKEAEVLCVLAQAEHKIDSTTSWASNCLHDALEIYQDIDDQAAMDRVLVIFQDLGIAVKMAGAAPTTAAAGAAAATPAAGDAAGAGASVAAVPDTRGLDAEMVTTTVQEFAKQAIGLDEEIFLDSPLMDSGMDSLTAVSFRNGLQQQLQVKLPSSLMFDYPTMKEVANRIVELSLED